MTDNLFISLIILAASLLQSAAGFGFALLAVPLLSLFMPMADIVPSIVILSTVTNFLIAGEQRKSLKIGEIAPLLIAGITGIPLGVRALGLVDQDILKAAAGLVITGTSAVMLFNWRINFRRKNVSFITAGLLSGVLGGSLSMSGPPVILFLTNEGYDKNSFRANLTFYGIATNLAAVASFWAGGLLGPGVRNTVVTGFLPLMAGSAVGIFLSGRIREAPFRKGVLILLILMSSLTAVKGIMVLF